MLLILLLLSENICGFIFSPFFVSFSEPNTKRGSVSRRCSLRPNYFFLFFFLFSASGRAASTAALSHRVHATFLDLTAQWPHCSRGWHVSASRTAACVMHVSTPPGFFCTKARGWGGWRRGQGARVTESATPSCGRQHDVLEMIP